MKKAAVYDVNVRRKRGRINDGSEGLKKETICNRVLGGRKRDINRERERDR